MKLKRILLAAVCAALLVPGTALAAPAATGALRVPANDTPSGARPVGPLPRTVTQNTTSATTDAIDARVSANCPAADVDASVWFTYTDHSGKGLVVDTSASDYSTGMIAVAGDPGSGGTFAECGSEELLVVGGEAGTTYYVMVFSDTAGVSGGRLSATFTAIPPDPTVSLTVAKQAQVTKNGRLRLHGTYSCADARDATSELGGTVAQRTGPTKVTGSFSITPLVCDGAVHRWNTVASNPVGDFAPGRASLSSFLQACGLLDCGAGFVNKRVAVTRAAS